MSRRRPALLAAVLAAGLAAAVPAAVAAAASASCRAAAAVAERRWALPANLLLAIGEVESGRPAAGGVQPWPWTADVAGQDYVFASLPEAVTVVGFLRDRGIRSIDVGCFQVNLQYHPVAFASLAQGFDPDANADYAASFLRRLFQRSGSWTDAIASYHSADPALGGAYRARVLLVWSGLRGSLPAVPFARPVPTQGDPHVILATAASLLIPVYTAETLPSALRALLGLPGAAKHLHK